jgi:hypothetical protein
MRIKKQKSFRSWGFLACLLAVTAYSAFMGTRSVHADPSCTTQQCSDAYTYALDTCTNHAGLLGFMCPQGADSSDFRFVCSDAYYELDDCSTFNPS